MNQTNNTDKPRPGSGEMFDKIANRYDLLNRVMSFGIDLKWRRKTIAALDLPENGKVLDVATGTGDLALGVARKYPSAKVIGIDTSARMLEVGRQKLSRKGLSERVILEKGDAQALKAGDDSFDGVCMAFGIRNVPDRKAALREIARVTRPGGRVAILELSEPQDGLIAPFAKFHIHAVVPRVGALLSGAKEYRYLQSSIAAFPPPDEFIGMMLECGLKTVGVVPFTFGVCHLYIGTPSQRPRKV